MKAALLPDRGVVRLAGAPARDFLAALVTADLADLSPQRARFAALLTPQGKIIADFFVVAAEDADDTLLLDCPRALCATLVQRLTLYRLRAKIVIEDVSEAFGVMALWNGGDDASGIGWPDPRLAALGFRAVVPLEDAEAAAAAAGAELVGADAYERHRIALAVPRGGLDFTYGDAFPHETCMDQLGGVDFDKGCYVGQEVVSRMQHRGTARTRIVGMRYADAAPEPGTPVLAGEKQIGTFGSAAGGNGIALLRLDRLADATAAGSGLTAGGIALEPVRPDWARFDMG